MEKKELENLLSSFKESPAEELLRFFLPAYRGKIALASSFSGEDQVLTDLILKIDAKARVFTIDTGRLPEETYAVIMETMDRMGGGLKFTSRKPPMWRLWKAVWDRTFSTKAWKTGNTAARYGRLNRWQESSRRWR